MISAVICMLLCGVWNLFNLPCVYALFWLISIPSYVFKYPRICFQGTLWNKLWRCCSLTFYIVTPGPLWPFMAKIIIMVHSWQKIFGRFKSQLNFVVGRFWSHSQQGVQPLFHFIWMKITCSISHWLFICWTIFLTSGDENAAHWMNSITTSMYSFLVVTIGIFPLNKETSTKQVKPTGS